MLYTTYPVAALPDCVVYMLKFVCISSIDFNCSLPAAIRLFTSCYCTFAHFLLLHICSLPAAVHLFTSCCCTFVHFLLLFICSLPATVHLLTSCCYTFVHFLLLYICSLPLLFMSCIQFQILPSCMLHPVNPLMSSKRRQWRPRG